MVSCGVYYQLSCHGKNNQNLLMLMLTSSELHWKPKNSSNTSQQVNPEKSKPQLIPTNSAEN